MTERLYELRIEASGEVRDAAGNVVHVDPVTGTAIVTETQAKAILAATQGESE